MPLTIEPIACSRIPNAMLRPACVGEKRPPPSNSVFVDSTRSAAPPIIVGAAVLERLHDLRRRRASRPPRRRRTPAAPRPAGTRLAGGTWSQSSRSAGNAADQRLEASAATASSSAMPALDAVHVLAHLVRDDERRVGVPAERLLRRAHLVVAERRAVRLRRVDRVRRPIARCASGRRSSDGRVGLRLRRSRSPRAARRGRSRRRRAARASPAPRSARRGPRRERDRGRAVDRDPVVVVEVDELAEPELAGDRRGLVRDALHQVAVGADRVDAVVDDRRRAAGCSGRRGSARRSPCRRRSRSPGRAGRWSSRCRACGCTRGGPASATPTAGSASAPRARGRSRRGGAPRTGGCRRGRRRGRSGRGRASAGSPGCARMTSV